MPTFPSFFLQTLPVSVPRTTGDTETIQHSRERVCFPSLSPLSLLFHRYSSLSFLLPLSICHSFSLTPDHHPCLFFFYLYLGRFDHVGSLASSTFFWIFFFCASVRCMCTTGPCVKVHRPNKPRTDWLALQPPRTPFALLTVRLSIPCDPLRDTMLTVPAVSLSLFPPVLFDGVVFIALVRWLSSSFTRRLINH